MPSQAELSEDQADIAVYHDERPRYLHKFRCKACGNQFGVTRFTADSSKVKIPNCPRKKCGGKAKQSFMDDVGMDVAAGKAPATTSIMANAYDTAMRFAMEDSQSTDIQDHSRPGAVVRNGESTAPKLPAHLQPMAENFWGGQRKKQNTRTARADLSPVFGQRAIDAQAGAPAVGSRFSADNAVGVAPILTAKPTGTSPVPDHRVIGSYNPTR